MSITKTDTNNSKQTDGVSKEIGCTKCPYAGHIEVKECLDAYTNVAPHCKMYNHEHI